MTRHEEAESKPTQKHRSFGGSGNADRPRMFSASSATGHPRGAVTDAPECASNNPTSVTFAGAHIGTSGALTASGLLETQVCPRVVVVEDPAMCSQLGANGAVPDYANLERVNRFT